MEDIVDSEDEARDISRIQVHNSAQVNDLSSIKIEAAQTALDTKKASLETIGVDTEIVSAPYLNLLTQNEDNSQIPSKLFGFSPEVLKAIDMAVEVRVE